MHPSVRVLAVVQRAAATVARSGGAKPSIPATPASLKAPAKPPIATSKLPLKRSKFATAAATRKAAAAEMLAKAATAKVSVIKPLSTDPTLATELAPPARPAPVRRAAVYRKWPGLPKYVHPETYSTPPPTTLARAQRGLFHGAIRQAGNNVPHSKHKTRRHWSPNVHARRLRSGLLGGRIRLTFTLRALRNIYKAGGLDEYVLKTPAPLLGWTGMRLRVQMRDALNIAAQQKSKPPVWKAKNRVRSMHAVLARPSLATARAQRMRVGKDGAPASAHETIQYLRKHPSALAGLPVVRPRVPL